MEQTIIVEPLQKRFTVQIKNANKAGSNRSFPNASNCCGARLREDMRCRNCDEKVVPKECNRKVVTIAKKDYLIDASALQDVKDVLKQMEDITIHTFQKTIPEGCEDRFASLSYAIPVENKEAQYKELAELLKGHYAIGKGVFNSNEYQIVVTTGDDGVIRVRKLVEESNRYDFDAEAIAKTIQNATVSAEILAIEKQIIAKKTSEGFDLTKFRDTRTEFEEKVIEDYVLNGKVPEIKHEVAEKQETNELERLKALMG